MNTDVLLLANLAATWFLAGLAWFLQTVHLPLLPGAGAADFAGYVKIQRQRNTRLMAPPMLIEMITGAWLLSTPLGHRTVYSAFLLLAIVWIVTFAWIIPLNSRLTRGYEESGVRRLIEANWIRTLCWTGRAALMLWITAERMHVY